MRKKQTQQSKKQSQLKRRTKTKIRQTKKKYNKRIKHLKKLHIKKYPQSVKRVNYLKSIARSNNHRKNR